MNLVLADTEEFRRVKRKQNKPAAPGASGSSAQTIESEEKRTLGLTIVRGAHIISLSVESPPPADPSARLGKSAPGGIPSALAAGPGVARPAGRGAAPPSLAVWSPPSAFSRHKLIFIRALPLVLAALRLLASLASLELPVSLVAEVVGFSAPDTRTGSLTIFKLPLPVSLEASLLPVSPEVLLSPLLASTLAALLPLDSTLLHDDRLCRRWIEIGN